MKPKSKNKKLIKDIPNFVPKFGELSKVKKIYKYKKKTWRKLYNKQKFYKTNIFHKLGFYEEKVTKEMHNDDPNVKQDYKTPHMGIFNNP